MLKACHTFRIVFMTEKDGEQNSHYQCVNGESEPYPVPILSLVGGKVMVDNITAYLAAQESTNSVGHHHEHPLRAGADS